MASVPLNYYDFLETFPQPGCAVCTLCERDVARFIDSHLYEYVNTPQTHAAIRASRGLCAIHSEQLANYGASVLGIAILQAHVLDEVLKIAADTKEGGFARLRVGSRKGAALADKLEATEPCMVCEVLDKAEQLHIDALAGHIEDARLQEAYRSSEGLCLPHFRMALRSAGSGARADILIGLQTVIWQRLKAELDSFAYKYDINHASEAMGAEGSSWRRAIHLVAGSGTILGRNTIKARRG
jgi:Family of unknown function (DUF6062)